MPSDTLIGRAMRLSDAPPLPHKQITPTPVGYEVRISALSLAQLMSPGADINSIFRLADTIIEWARKP